MVAGAANKIGIRKGKNGSRASFTLTKLAMRFLKILIGLLFWLGALLEFGRICSRTLAGQDWPFGAELGLLLVVAIGYRFIKSGFRKKETRISG